MKVKNWEGEKGQGGYSPKIFLFVEFSFNCFFLFHFLNIFEQFIGERHLKKTEQREKLH